MADNRKARATFEVEAISREAPIGRGSLALIVDRIRESAPPQEADGVVAHFLELSEKYCPENIRRQPVSTFDRQGMPLGKVQQSGE